MLGQGIFWQTVCQSRLAIGRADNAHAVYQHTMDNSQSKTFLPVFPAHHYQYT